MSEYKQRNALLDPAFWDAFMERAGQPIEQGAPTWGSLVPGLGPYMATRNALSAYSRGDPEAALSHATEAGLWLVPPAAGVAAAGSKLFGAGARNLPLPVLPGLNSAGGTEEDKKRARLAEALRYNNPALTSEYWRARGFNGRDKK